MLLSGKQQLPPCVFSIYETGSIYKEEEERLQPRMQCLQTTAIASEMPARTGLPALGQFKGTDLQTLLATCKVCFPEHDTCLHPL